MNQEEIESEFAGDEFTGDVPDTSVLITPSGDRYQILSRDTAPDDSGPRCPACGIGYFLLPAHVVQLNESPRPLCPSCASNSPVAQELDKRNASHERARQRDFSRAIAMALKYVARSEQRERDLTLAVDKAVELFGAEPMVSRRMR